MNIRTSLNDAGNAYVLNLLLEQSTLDDGDWDLDTLMDDIEINSKNGNYILKAIYTKDKMPHILNIPDQYWNWLTLRDETYKRRTRLNDEGRELVTAFLHKYFRNFHSVWNFVFVGNAETQAMRTGTYKLIKSFSNDGEAHALDIPDDCWDWATSNNIV